METVSEFDREFTKATDLSGFEYDQVATAALLLEVDLDEVYAGNAYNTDQLNELLYTFEQQHPVSKLLDIRMYKFEDHQVAVDDENIGVFCTRDVGLSILSTFGS